jgi:hypothetical protein
MQNPRAKAMTLIQQKFAADCAVACLAMFLGVEYEDVLRHIGGHELTLRGLTNSREAYIAQLFEVEISFLDRTKIDHFVSERFCLSAKATARIVCQCSFGIGQLIEKPKFATNPSNHGGKVRILIPSHKRFCNSLTSYSLPFSIRSRKRP